VWQTGVQLDWPLDPLEVIARWPDSQRLLALHSGRFDPCWAKRSLIASPTATYRFVNVDGGRSELLGERSGPNFTHDPFRDIDLLMDWPGLWIGYLSYDLGRFVERLPDSAADDRGWPIVELGYCPGWLTYDMAERRWEACGTWAEAGPPDLLAAPSGRTFEASEPVGVFEAAGYRAAVQRVIDYIAAGDVFQVNLAQRFSASIGPRDPRLGRAVFRRLMEVSPAWYAAYLELSDPGRAIASTSPELFLEVDEDRQVVTRPIKGTRPASVAADELRDSVKDQAELNMIVDLMRNDLGRVCEYGSVTVPQPRVIESHPTVHHGVSTIRGRLRGDCTAGDLLRAVMPGGSITGAPKVRAMEIIDELEPVRRGPYCGCLGVLGEGGMALNIAIRTMLLDAVAGRVDFSVGGGIVADSDPQAEYQETLDKAAAIAETLGITPTGRAVE